MTQPFLGEIVIYAFNFAPRGWVMCNGQILPINQNQALFSLLGTTFGGDGVTTFALPDLRGRTPIGSGQGPGLSNYNLGEVTGEAGHTLISAEMPSHTHTPNCNSGAGTSASPGGNVWAADGSHVTKAYAAAANLQNMAAGISANAGGASHENRQPLLVLNACIAISGIFPSRN